MNSLPRLLTRQLYNVQQSKTILPAPIGLGVRNYAGYWNKDWAPGPYPKTEAERRAAAKKYNLIPEDYEPYADDGTGYGDYPKLPIVSAESKDQHLNWEFDELKRNYGEPLHVDADLYGEDRWDRSRRLRFTIREQLGYFLGVMGVFGLLYYWGNSYKVCYVRVMPKQMPYHYRTAQHPEELAPDTKIVHHTFELKKC